nr:PREDICTED: chymotrypsin-like elastase family member 2A [Lepisosteus oculatus]
MPDAEVECGERTKANVGPSTRIYGGSSVNRGQWPWVVSIQEHVNDSFGYYHYCGGSIVDKQWVMTAARCVSAPYSGNPETILIKAGVTNAHTDSNNYTQELGVAKIIIHNEYNPITHQNDIALLKLRTPAEINDHVKPVCLPTTADEQHHLEYCHFTGFGLQENGTYGILQEAVGEVILTHICNYAQWLNLQVTPEMFCAGSMDAKVSACEGDHGSPFQCRTPLDKRFYAYGIRSFGIGCGQKQQPSVYTRVSHYYYWVNDIIGVDTSPSTAPTDPLILSLFVLTAACVLT